MKVTKGQNFFISVIFIKLADYENFPNYSTLHKCTYQQRNAMSSEISHVDKWNDIESIQDRPLFTLQAPSKVQNHSFLTAHQQLDTLQMLGDLYMPKCWTDKMGVGFRKFMQQT